MRQIRILSVFLGLVAAVTFGLLSAGSSSAQPSASSGSSVASRVAADLAAHGGTQVAPDTVDHHGYTTRFLASGAVVRPATSIPSCNYGHLCVYTPSNNTVYDYYKCGYYDTTYLIGDGTFNNNQTRGTVAKFYNQNGSLRWTSTAPATGTASWTYVWHIRPC